MTIRRLAPKAKEPIIKTRRTCAVIGNASSIMGSGNGKSIDNHHIVVRINVPEIIAPHDQGTKTNVLFVHNLTIKNIPPRPPYSIINVSTDIRQEFDDWTDILVKETGNEKARPTTGFIAIAYMVKMNYRVSIFGFDWWKTPTHYTKVQPWKHHYPEWEEDTVMAMLEKNHQDAFITLNVNKPELPPLQIPTIRPTQIVKHSKLIRKR